MEIIQLIFVVASGIIDDASDKPLDIVDVDADVAHHLLMIYHHLRKFFLNLQHYLCAHYYCHLYHHHSMQSNQDLL